MNHFIPSGVAWEAWSHCCCVKYSTFALLDAGLPILDNCADARPDEITVTVTTDRSQEHRFIFTYPALKQWRLMCSNYVHIMVHQAPTGNPLEMS